ncbi:hypothetical protein EIQ14_14165 [Xanthomonas campestris pv. campestris]
MEVPVIRPSAVEGRQQVVKKFFAGSGLAYFWLFFTRIPADPHSEHQLRPPVGHAVVLLAALNRSKRTLRPSDDKRGGFLAALTPSA